MFACLLACLLIATSIQAQTTSLQVTNNSNCTVEVSLRAYHPQYAPTLIPSITMVFAPAASYTFSTSNLADWSSNVPPNIVMSSEIISAIVTSPNCHQPADGVQVWNPDFSNPIFSGPSDAWFLGCCPTDGINVSFQPGTPQATLLIY